MDAESERRLAERYAPVLCHELSARADKRPFDCFTRVDFDGEEPWADRDRKAAFLAAFEAGQLVPSVYYSLVSTPSHYFILYSIYHAFDQKHVGAHEHDFEHVQVVVRRSERATDPDMELMSTNAHHSYFYYVPYEAGEASTRAYLAFYSDDRHEDGELHRAGTNPVVHVQPGDGSLFGILTEVVGHGIRGLASIGASRWDEAARSFRFSNESDIGRQIGILATPLPGDDQPVPFDPSGFDGVVHTEYELVPVRETIWPTFIGAMEQGDVGPHRPIGGLFKEVGRWRPESQRLKRDSSSRRDYFREVLGNELDDVHFPEGLVGSRRADGRRRKAAGKWPFQWEAIPQASRWYRLLHGSGSSWGGSMNEHRSKELDAFFDPAFAYRVLATPPRGRKVDLRYDYHPFLGVS